VVRLASLEEAPGCQVSLLTESSASRAESAGRFSRNELARGVSGVRTVILTSPPRSDTRTSTRRSPPVTSNLISCKELALPASGALSLSSAPGCCTALGTLLSGRSDAASATGGVAGPVCGIILLAGVTTGVSGEVAGSMSARRVRASWEAV
jgi:hypothetical protein